MSTATNRLSWRKLSAAKWGDAWLERLNFLGPGRAMIIEFPGRKTVRVEAHGLTAKEGKELVAQFGGQTTPMKWEPTELAPRPPIKVRQALVVVSSEAELNALEGDMPAVLIPAGMAFGTGEHATTATCLRLLADAAKTRRGAAWEALDLGTGSGILAIAAAKLGAAKVLATDFDPHAVRTAKANVKENCVRGVKVLRSDVREWTPEQRWPVVTANLFSNLLIEVAPKIARALEPGGTFIFSGILRAQEEEVSAALRQAGFAVSQTVRKGKWIAGVAQFAPPKRRGRK